MSRHAKRRISRTLVGVGALFSVLLVAASGGFAADSTLYVDRSSPWCSDSGSGTAVQPFCTIGAAASRATAGKTVEVASGTYPEVVTVAASGTSVAPVVFKAAPGASVTVSGQANGFVVASRSWVTIAGFAVKSTTGVGIRVSNSSRITLSGNHVSYSGKPESGKTHEGIRLSNVSDSRVSGNTTDHNSDAGILLDNASTRNVVSGNRTFSNARGYERAAPGIRLYGAPGNTVAGNIAHHNEDSGIEFYSSSNNSLAYDNVTYDNGDHGLDNNKCTGQRMISNTVYRNVTAGINLEGGSTGGTVANNVSVDNGIDSPRTKGNIRVDSGSVTGTTMNSDLVHLRTAGVMLVWRSISYSSLAALRSATGQESRGIEAVPRWRSPSTGDFHLTSGSPAIDSADSGASGQPSADVEGTPRLDDGATPNTGIGPRAYDDRGAYEHAPQGDAPPSAVLQPASSPDSVPGHTIVTPKDKCVVPKLNGRKLGAAKRSLKRANCRLGKVRRARSSRRPGTVIRQSRKAGKRLAAGSKVGVVLAKRR